MNIPLIVAISLLITTFVHCQPSCAVQLISNGGFETGDLTGWTVVNQAGSSGSWYGAQGAVAPMSGQATVGAATGTFYAVTDQVGPGTHSLSQDFTLALPATSVILSFKLFANNLAGPTVVSPGGLDYTGFTNQHARVDILSASASPLDTGAGVLANLFLGSQPGGANAYTTYFFDITGLVGGGGAFRLRFAESDNSGFFNLGIDDATLDAALIPEPSTIVLLAFGLAALVLLRKRFSANSSA